MNQATESNQHGEVTKVSTQKIKERYGYLPKEYKQMQEDIKDDKPMVNVLKAKIPKTANQCFNDKMSDFLEGLIPVEAMKKLYSNPNQKDILNFSKKAIKAGIKGNTASIAAQITYYYSYCLITHAMPILCLINHISDYKYVDIVMDEFKPLECYSEH